MKAPLTIEEQALRYEKISSQQRLRTQTWIAKNQERYKANIKSYYELNKDRLNARSKELRRIKKELAAAIL